MMIDKKDLGKLFFCGFNYFDENTYNLIRKYSPAGLLVYPGDMNNSYELINVFERISELQNEGMEFLVCSDHEGGQLETIPLVPTTPGNFVYGNNGNNEMIEKYAATAAKYMKLAGFNMVFSPVLDIYHEGTSPVVGFRTFGKDPQKVAENAKYMIKGYENNGVASCAKHYPGHGRAIEDSHENLPRINVSLEELMETDLVPFRKCVESGVESIMTAHLIFSDIDEYPATISNVFVKDILRDKFGFEGVIITDALEMKAMSENYSKEEIVKRFFNAGGDMLMIGWGNLMLEDFAETLYRLIENGEVDIENIKKSIARVEKLMKKYSSSENIGFLKNFSQDAFDFNLDGLEKSFDKVYLISPQPANLSMADITARDYSMIKGNVSKYFDLEDVIYYDLRNAETSKSISEISENSLIIDVVVDAFRSENLLALHKNIAEKSSNVVYLILRDPKDIEFFKNSNYIATFSSNALAVSKAMELIKP